MEPTRIPPSCGTHITHKALFIDEILNHILLFADEATQASCARVSRDWFEPAIRVLWDAVYSIWVMKLLAPISWVSGSDGPVSHVGRP
jgi:hypothetical protein